MKMKIYTMLAEQVHKTCTYETRHDKTNKMSVRPANTQISLGIRASLIRVFSVRSMGS